MLLSSHVIVFQWFRKMTRWSSLHLKDFAFIVEKQFNCVFLIYFPNNIFIFNYFARNCNFFGVYVVYVFGAYTNYHTVFKFNMKKIMKSIFLGLISILILGLYSCGDESTNTEEKKEEIVRKDKYTIDDILADSNWVEVLDTLNYIQSKDDLCIATEQYSDTVHLITNLKEYKSLYSQNEKYKILYKDSSTSCLFNYIEPNFDFNKYDKFYSVKSIYKSMDYIHKIYFKYKLNSYFFYKEIWSYSVYKIAVAKYCFGIYTVNKRLNNSNVYNQDKFVRKVK